MPYPAGRYSDDTLTLQRALVLNGFDIGKAGADGKMGADTIRAIGQAREHYALPGARNLLDVPLLVALGVRGAPAKPIRKPGLFDVLALLLNLSKGNHMKWSTIEQLIRIAAYAGGGAVFGQQIADGQMFQAAIGGAIAVGAFVWWLVFERNRPKA